jgi:hypothetical protein
MYIRINIIKIILMNCLPFIISCQPESLANTSGSTDPSKNNPIYAHFTFDYGVKGVAPVDMTNSELTGGTLTEESDPEDSNNLCIKLNKTSTIPSDQVTMYKDFTAITEGIVSVEAKVRVTNIL